MPDHWPREGGPAGTDAIYHQRDGGRRGIDDARWPRIGRSPLMRHTTSSIVVGAWIVLGALALGCSSTAIAIKEKFGYAKREQLVDRVKDARDEQVGAKKQFSSALAEFMAVTGASGGDLEAKYEKLKKEYDRSESRADAVRGRIDDVKRVGDALFKEWR